MPSRSVIEIEALLRPFSPDAPTGTNLQADDSPSPLFVKLRSLRKAASDTERAAEVDPAGESAAVIPPEWRELRELATQALSQESKDITVATWLLEALVRLEGFAGLRDGIMLLRGLVEKYWDNLWPLPDQEGMRLKSIIDLNGATRPGTLLAPIARVPITEGGPESRYAHWHFKRAATPRAQPAEGSDAPAPAEGPDLAELRQAFDRSSDEFVKTLKEDLAQCLAEFDALCEALRQRAGAEGPPPSSRIRNAIQEVVDAVQQQSGSRGDPGEAAANATAGGTGGAAESGAGAANGPLKSREAAFTSLNRVADYFRRTEPHSPLSYLLEQAVRWGRLPLPALLEELIPDESARTQYRKLTGIPAPKPPKADE